MACALIPLLFVLLFTLGEAYSGGGNNVCCRRLQASSASLTKDDAEYQNLLNKCGHHQYEGLLHIDLDTHFYAVAVPANQNATAAGCPSFATHAVFDRFYVPTVPTRKEILVWNDPNEAAGSFRNFADGSSLPIGTFPLGHIARAHEQAQASRSSWDMYDLVTNNCADYMVSLASALGVKVDARVTSFVARRLLQVSGKVLADRIRASVHFLSFFHQGHRHLRATATDAQVVELLVQSQAAEIL